MTWASINDSTRIVTWGAAPLKQFQKDCEIHHLTYPIKNTVINLKKLISRRYNNNSIGFHRTIHILKINSDKRDLRRPVDRAHSLCDIYKIIV